MKKILVTGAKGFIGQHLCKHLIKLNYSVKGTVRNLDDALINCSIKYISLGNIDVETKWYNALEGVDCVIHCASEAHETSNIKKSYIRGVINIDSIKHLAEHAVKAKVKRFIFLSSVKVNGETTGKSMGFELFTNKDIPNPLGNYAISKFEAEKALWEVASKTGLEIVVVRLPLVYGHGIKGNLARLIKIIYSKIPLPFGGIKNKRSLIGIDNLIDMLARCVEHPDIAGKIFLVSDGEDLSTPELIRLLASTMGQSAKLFTVPTFLLKFLGFVIGKQKEIDRLTDSLQIDSSHVREILNWTPPVSVEEGIRKMVKDK
jgi:nucleoside-diphosphate-sugar epimerase